VERSGSFSWRAGERSIIVACLCIILISAHPVLAIGLPVSFATPQLYAVPPPDIVTIPKSPSRMVSWRRI
jgi:hypothetical protein